MRLYDTERINVISVPKRRCRENNITIQADDILNMGYEDYTKLIRNSLKSAMNDVEENMIFKITLDTAEELDDDDVEQFYLYCTSALCKMLLAGGKREREKRLSVVNSNLYINYNVLLDLINYKTKINCFNIIFMYKDKKISFVA